MNNLSLKALSISTIILASQQNPAYSATIKGSFDFLDPEKGSATFTIKKDDANMENPFVSGTIEFDTMEPSIFEGKYNITKAVFLPSDWSLIGVFFDFNGNEADFIVEPGSGEVIGKFNNDQEINGDNFNSRHVPEPLIMLGSAAALGFGGLFQRKKSKKKNKAA